jgi:hypothetical protein
MRPFVFSPRALCAAVVFAAFLSGGVQAAVRKPARAATKSKAKPKPKPKKIVRAKAAAPQAKPAAKTQPVAVQAEVLIYARGAALFFQDAGGGAAREEKLELPPDSKIESLSASRDGSRLAFGAGQKIYLFDVKAAQLKEIVPQDGRKYLYPSLSPDGRSVSCRPYAVDATLCILSEDGTVRDLGASTKNATRSRFSRDGKWLYFADGPHFYRIATEAGGEATRLVRGHYVEWFDVNAEGIVVAPIPGEKNVRLALIAPDNTLHYVEMEGEFHQPVWSPDGKSIAYSSQKRDQHSEAQGIFVIKPGEAAPVAKVLNAEQTNGSSRLVWTVKSQ